MGQIIIREALLNDFEAIYGLNRDVMGYDYDLESTRRRLDYILRQKGHKVFVAQQDDTVIGYIHGNDYDLLYGEPMKNILGIAVSENERFHGVGRLLLYAVEEWGRKTGAAGIRLTSGMGRTGAHAFYAACGYSSNKDQKRFVKIL